LGTGTRKTVRPYSDAIRKELGQRKVWVGGAKGESARREDASTPPRAERG